MSPPFRRLLPFLAALAVAAVAAVAAYLSYSYHLAFKSPLLLLCLLAVPVAGLLYALLERRRAGQAAQWSSPALLTNMVVGAPGRLRYVPAGLFLVALTLLLMGFARPEARFTEARNGATIVVLLDTSGSMGSNDVKPTRLGAADAALTRFVDKLPSGYQVALVTFSDGIAVKVPPTYDHKDLIAGLPRQPQLAGTAIGDALAAAVTVAEKAVGPSRPGKPHPPATILLVSDGGQNTGRTTVAQAAAAARKAAIPVSTVLLGTAHGQVRQMVPVGSGTKKFPLVSQVPVDPANLQAIARGSGGTFYAADSASRLAQVYKSLGTRLVYDKQFREITVRVTALAMALILVGAALSGLWFRRVV